MHVFIPLAYPIALLFGYGVLFLPAIRGNIVNLLPWIDAFYIPQVYFLIGSIAILKKLSISNRRIGLCLPTTAKPIYTATLLAMLPFLAFFVSELTLHALRQPIETRFTSINSAWTLESLVKLFVLAPLSEELLFRGILLSALLGAFEKRTAVLLSALLFMFAHGLWAFGPLCLGIIAAIMTLRFQSLVPGMVFHCLSNGYLPVLSKFFPVTNDIVLHLPILIR